MRETRRIIRKIISILFLLPGLGGHTARNFVCNTCPHQASCCLIALFTVANRQSAIMKYLENPLLKRSFYDKEDLKADSLTFYQRPERSHLF
jgi:hypothetical protein